jgi:HlyD family secretion protein
VLAGAVIAPGLVVVESNIKKVQHPTGGIVSEILVKEGAAVAVGDVVMRLDHTLTRSTLGVVRSQLDELQAREARLQAGREDNSTIVFTPDILARAGVPALALAIAGEEKLFEARRFARNGQRSQLRERIKQSEEEIGGLFAQQAAKEQEISLITDELVGVTQLYEKKLVSISRLMVLRRDKAKLSGERGQYVAEIARARGKISETEMQIIQLDQDLRTEVLKELREGQGKIAELRERLVAAEDQLKRVDICAPQSGTVHQLSVHTVGVVIADGETVMIIVPNADNLVIDAKIAAQDVDQIVAGAKAIVRITAGNQRTITDLNGELVRVSADVAHDPPGVGQPGQPFYQVRVSLPRAQNLIALVTFISCQACPPKRSYKLIRGRRCNISLSHYTIKFPGPFAKDKSL